MDSSVAQEGIKNLLNWVEEVAGGSKTLELGVQKLKNEQGKPVIKPNKSSQKQTDISFEKKGYTLRNVHETTYRFLTSLFTPGGMISFVV